MSLLTSQLVRVLTSAWIAQTYGPSGVLSPLRDWWTCGPEWSQAKFKTHPMGILTGCHEH